MHYGSGGCGGATTTRYEQSAEAGLEPDVHERVYQPPVRTGALLEAWIDLNRQQLCLPPERRDEVVELMQRHPPQPRRSVVLSWPGAG